MPHLPQIRTHEPARRIVVDLEAAQSFPLLTCIDERHIELPRQRDMSGRDANGIDDDAIDALLGELHDILELLFLLQLAHEQDALIPRRLQDAPNAREQLADRDGIHARQHDADELAPLHLEPLREEIRLIACLLDDRTDARRLCLADITPIEIARYRTLRYPCEIRDVLYRDLLRPGNAILPHIIQLLFLFSSFYIDAHNVCEATARTLRLSLSVMVSIPQKNVKEPLMIRAALDLHGCAVSHAAGARRQGTG